MGEKVSNQMNYEELREKYSEFIYKSYSVDVTKDMINIKFYFEIPGLGKFEPAWSFGDNGLDVYTPLFSRIVFNLGMAELVSYWKIACPKKVTVKAGALTKEQIEWWKDLYFNGLGEFFYTNKINASYEDFMEIESDFLKGVNEEESEEVSERQKAGEYNETALIAVGGGKDSVVSMELTKKTGMKANTYIINPRGATINTSAAGGYEKPVVAKRTLDPLMLELNKQGFLNGHTPFSAIVSFSSIIAAHINGFRYVVLSNESSANESTVKGSSVNHQYSKSFRYEKAFVDYEKTYIKSGVHYFSFLRPLSEYQIAMQFARYPKYHKIFRSCNVGSKEDVWCGHCAKCLFVSVILSPFLKNSEIADIIGNNMLDNPQNIDLFRALIGEVDEKPFECVGSRDEINTALVVAMGNMESEGEKLPKLLEYYKTTELYREYKGKKNNYPKFYDKENLLPPSFEKIMKETVMGD